MAAFKRTEIFKPPRGGPKITEDTIYWKDFEFPVSIKEYGPIDFIDFSEQEPFNFAVTSSSKIQVFSSETNEVLRVLSRFKKAAYGGKFRRDGKLLASGSEEGLVSLFDVQRKAQLRLFKGHNGPVHRCDFTQCGTQIASFSDDQSVCLWDIPSEKKLAVLEGHNDYIRAGVISPASQSLIISGSYDHTVKLFDIRSSECVHSFNHGSPVESVIGFPTGGIAISCGGCSVKVWDLAVGRLLAQISQHHKTVTSLCFGSRNTRLLSAGLDKHVKIYDVGSYQVVHTLEFPAPLLSLALSVDDKSVVGGMTDGLISIRHRKEPEEDKEISKDKKKHYRYRVFQDEFRPVEGDVFVKQEKQESLMIADKYLKSFQSTKALDSVMRDFSRTRTPNIAISVIKELIRRSSLIAALAGRDSDSLLPIMKFLTRYICDPKYTRTLLDVATILIDIYGSKLGDSTELKEQFEKLHNVVDKELKYIQELLKVAGVLQTVLNVSSSQNILGFDDNVDILPVPEAPS